MLDKNLTEEKHVDLVIDILSKPEPPSESDTEKLKELLGKAYRAFRERDTPIFFDIEQALLEK